MNFDHFLRFAPFCQAVSCALRDLVGFFHYSVKINVSFKLIASTLCGVYGI